MWLLAQQLSQQYYKSCWNWSGPIARRVGYRRRRKLACELGQTAWIWGPNGIPSGGQVVLKMDLSELDFHGPKWSCQSVGSDVNSLPGCSGKWMDSPPDPIHTPDAVDPKGWWALPLTQSMRVLIFIGGKVTEKLTSPLDGHLMSKE